MFQISVAYPPDLHRSSSFVKLNPDPYPSEKPDTDPSKKPDPDLNSLCGSATLLFALIHFGAVSRLVSNSYIYEFFGQARSNGPYSYFSHFII
jgi:hypothetical protein